MTQTLTLEEKRELERQQQRAIAEMNGEDPDGKSIEDLAEDGVDEEDGNDEPYIEGSTGQLSLSVGGRKPDSATFKMKGTEVKVRDGQYTKGETVELRVIARIDEIKFIDMHDDYGTVTSTKRVHMAKPIHVTRADESE